MLRLRGVGVTFQADGQRLAALSDIDLDLPGGETLALIGPSGCGKSTLLRLIIGLVTPTAGRLEFDEPLNAGGDWLARRRRMGYVIQDGGLFPHLTAERNVLLPGREFGRPEAALQERLAELSALTRFPPDALARYPTELSGGQRQRVALMRALLLDPALLLLDEPLGALDPMVRTALQSDLKTIFETLGKTVVLVTHDIAEAAWLARTLVLLRDGRIVQRGTLADFRERPASPWVTEFINAQRSLVQL